VSTGLLERPAAAGTGNGGVPARRAVIRWAWRMFRREWRQQLLVLGMIVVAVAAIVVGSATAKDTPPAANAGFGTATDMATFQAPAPHLASQIAALRNRFHTIDVIENQTVAVPGSVNTYDLRAQNPHGRYGQPLLSLVSGHYPASPGQVAVTSGVASELHLRIGSTLTTAGVSRRVVGMVQNPQSLLDEFALVVPGQVTAPSQVTVLFDAPGVRPHSIGPTVSTPQSIASAQGSNPLNPTTIVLALATVGMLLIALVSVGGFTVLAQRRLRSLGMLGALGATDRNIRLVVRINGVLVGVTGAVVGLVLGLAAWLAYRPIVESDAHHLIGPFQLPWIVIGPAMALAVLATYFAASRPARAITRIPVVTALAGRPAPPRQVRRSAVPGLIVLAVSVVLFAYTGKVNGNGNGGALELVGGFITLIAAVILLAPFCLTVLARAGRRAPIAARLALRDLARYRARSGSALAAITLGVLIAMMVIVLSAQRFGNVLDWAGPNVASNQLIVYTPNGPGNPAGGPGQPALKGNLQSWGRTARAIAAALGSHEVVPLIQPNASLTHAASGRQWTGTIYLATPQLLHAFGIPASQVDPNADVLSMRPGLSGLGKMQLPFSTKGGGGQQGGPGGGGPQGQQSFPCPKSSCLANPVIQEISALPSGTSAPNTVFTEHAVRTLHLTGAGTGNTVAWFVQTPNPPTPTQITNARATAAAAGMSIETKNSIPTSADIINWATVFGVVLALGILAMSVGLIRSETASDLRTLAATGASSWTRRTITGVTAGALALAGAVLGTVAAYAAVIGYSWDNSLDGLSELTNVPVRNLLVILVGMPLVAAIGGWLLAGRQPDALTRQPIE
jgi:putative ABC transport system permease protein